MGILSLLRDKFMGKGESLASRKVKCPNCGKDTPLDVERCPSCGVHVKGMFRKKCPKCGAANELDAEKCQKCKFDFAVEIARAKKTVYLCPICRYKADYYMLRCPSCNARFV